LVVELKQKIAMFARTFTPLLLFLLISNPIFSQKASFAQTIHAGVFGDNLFKGINYDLRFNKAKTDGLGLQIGLAAFANGQNTDQYIAPIELSNLYKIGSSAICLETNAGMQLRTVYLDTNAEYGLKRLESIPFGTLGLRYNPSKNGLMFRAFWQPLIVSGDLQPNHFGASLGYAFGRKHKVRTLKKESHKHDYE
jgi:hypothetical protein